MNEKKNLSFICILKKCFQYNTHFIKYLINILFNFLYINYYASFFPHNCLETYKNIICIATFLLKYYKIPMKKSLFYCI